MFLTMKSKNIQTNKLVDVTLDKNKTNKKMSPETSALIWKLIKEKLIVNNGNNK